MRLPPWAIEAIRNGVVDVARKASDPETITKVRAQAAELLKELPDNASRSLDAIVKAATDTARDAIDQGLDSVSRWTQRESDLVVHCFNASGILFSDHGTGVGVPDKVVEMGIAALRGDVVTKNLLDRIEQSLTTEVELAGKSLAIAVNLDAAVSSLAALAGDRKIVLHRSQAIRLPSGLPLPEAFGGVELTECGGVQALDAADFDGLDHAVVVLADDGTRAVESIDFGSRDVVVVVVAPFASLKSIHESIPSAESLLQSAADLVVLQGGPMTGGPTCGMLVGDRALVEAIRVDARWRYMKASSEVAAMTLASMSEPTSIPLKVLVETGEENLRSRAERLAIRLTADDQVEACQITDDPAQLVGDARWSFPSRQLRLRHKSQSSVAWADELLKQNPAVITRPDEEDLVIDLRWLPASSDAAVADAITNDSAIEPDADEEPDTSETQLKALSPPTESTEGQHHAPDSSESG